LDGDVAAHNGASVADGNASNTLTADEVYALCAYILALSKIIGENDTINAETLPKVKMPNAGNFIIAYPDRI